MSVKVSSQPEVATRPVTGSAPAPAAPPAAPKADAPKSTMDQLRGLEANRKSSLRGALRDAVTNAQRGSSQIRAAVGGDGIVSSNKVNKDGTINSRTSVPLRGNADRVRVALEGDWSKWWKHSEVTGRSAADRSFTIRPLGTIAGQGPSVGIKLGEPQRQKDANGLTTIRIPMHVTGDFEGEGTATIRETAKGKSTLTFDWPNFKVNGALSAVPAVAAGAHTLALEGDTPFLNGTGFEGLQSYLAGGLS